MPASSPTLDWLLRHHAAGVPRMPDYAQRLVLFAAAAELDQNTRGKDPGLLRAHDTAMHVSQRAIALNRTKAHFKCDNRTAI